MKEQSQKKKKRIVRKERIEREEGNLSAHHCKYRKSH
jgi:hypothetical protein